MTLIWSLGKNLDKYGNFEYIGFAHYRRCLSFMFHQLQPNNILCNRSESYASIKSLYDVYHNINA